ncbi:MULTISPECIES: DUF4240 domain-containing protein [unclassified Streptomyces]|uniref:DUF4240 domain-containing protein n=1 Tax=unclassified Streptomyces TaxID=2593676 RepID=UPI00381D42B2
MDTSVWWGLVERARVAVGEARAEDRDARDDPLPRALTDVLVPLGADGIVAFGVRRITVTDSAYHYPLWNAAYLIEGGCGDDGFMDFRDGLALQGRAVFERAVADPDSLADLPLVVRMSRGESGWLGFESLNHLVREAYREVRGETDTLDAALTDALRGLDRPGRPTGDDWDAEDEEETRRRLPRLSGLFLL